MALAKLFILGQEIEFLWTDTNYHREIRINGKPATEIMGGLITVCFETTGKTDIVLRWMTKESEDDTWNEVDKMENGKVCFYENGFDYPPTKTYKFNDAHLIYFKENFYSEGEEPMQTVITISPAIQNYGTDFVKRWNENWIPPSEQTPYQPAENTDEFYLSIKHLTNKKTFVPFGIPTFSGTPENKNIEFEIEITENGIDDFQIEFLHDNKIIQTYYSGRQTLNEVVVTAKGSGNNSSSNTSNNQNTQSNYPKGKYLVKWDGFDSNGIYDSTIFTTGKLKARIKGKRNGKEKTAESDEFSFEYEEVNWVDVKINKNSKRIDVTLRVNLKDGGEIGTEKDCKKVGSGSYAPERTICPWDKIPEKEIKSHQTIIKTRTKSFEDLKEMALDGINTH